MCGIASRDAFARLATLDRTNLYALAFRVGATRTSAARAAKIATYVDMLARGEVLHPVKEKAPDKVAPAREVVPGGPREEGGEGAREEDRAEGREAIEARTVTATLVTIPISHYGDRARWTLDLAGVPYRELHHLQMFSWFAALRRGGRKTLPVVEIDGKVLTDSSCGAS